MKIAIWIDYNFSPQIGGTFSYVDRLLRGIDEFKFDDSLQICFATSCFVQVGSVQKELLRLRSPYDIVLSIIPFFSKVKLLQKITRRLSSAAYRKQLEGNGVRILFYPSQFVRHIDKFPFIVSHWDIAHRSTYAFPEFSNVLHDYREEYYRNFLPKALMIFAESNAGKDELIRYTNLNGERIRIVPIFAGESSAIKVPQTFQDELLNSLCLQKYKYFYYPAQFLAEKNHYGVIRALSIIISRYPNFKVVFTGASPKKLYGTLEYIKSQVVELGLEKNVVFAGFQSLEGVYTLYNNACAHIMASYVGPTNMPPLEAMAIGCPVICSDLSGHREEMEDAAIYFDAKRPDTLADAMIEMINHRSVYEKKINELSLNTTFTLENALKKLNHNFQEASIIRNSWA